MGFSYAALPLLRFPFQNVFSYISITSAPLLVSVGEAPLQANQCFLTTGSSRLLSCSLTTMRLMADVSANHLLQCYMLVQPIERQQRKNILLKLIQQENKCGHLIFISSHPHITLCSLHCLGPELLLEEEIQINTEILYAFHLPKALTWKMLFPLSCLVGQNHILGQLNQPSCVIFGMLFNSKS